MRLEAIACANCGAPLEIPPESEFVTCNHCHGHLSVCRNDSVTYTKLVQEIDKRTQQMAEDISDIRRSQALTALDQEWEREKAKFTIRGKDGREYEPTTAIAIVQGILGSVLCAIVTATLVSVGGRGFLWLGLVLVGTAIATATYIYTRAQAYTKAQARYLRKRSELLRDGSQSSLGF